jgi:hypothetical protein
MFVYKRIKHLLKLKAYQNCDYSNNLQFQHPQKNSRLLYSISKNIISTNQNH